MIFKSWLWVSSAIAGSTVVFIIGFLCVESYMFLSSPEANQLLSSTLWFPKEGSYGALALITGTLCVAAGGLVMAIPLSWMSAFAIVFYLNKRLSNWILTIFEVFASVPPVIVGLFGLVVVIPTLSHWSPPGFGILSSAIVLSLLLVPHLTAAACEILRFELKDLKQIARSLGLNQQALIRKIVWPERRQALWRSAGLMSGRALGETLAIMMVAGNAVRLPTGLFDSIRTVNSTLALEMPYAKEPHRSALFALGLLTFVFILILQSLFKRGPR